jgi:hypothetical protein
MSGFALNSAIASGKILFQYSIFFLTSAGGSVAGSAAAFGAGCGGEEAVAGIVTGM